MIQELLGSSNTSLLGGERKISFPCPPLEISSTTTTNSVIATSSPSESPNQNQNQNQNQNLRCPRCDSSNTKFCYYNNYNLTQPRHFCKTCRRYWTKGGALRNVPIGGGCRKSKNVTVTSSQTNARLKTTLSCEIGKLGFDGYNNNSNNNNNTHDHQTPINPMLWAPPPQSSHLLSLLRSNQNPNPNPNPNSVAVKEEGFMHNTQTQTLGLGQFSPFCRSNPNQQGQQTGFVLGHDHNQNSISSTTGVNQDFYQRLRSSGNYYPNNHHHYSPVMMMNTTTNVATSSTSSAPSTVSESTQVAAANVSGDLGFWNPIVSWSDLPTTSGAYS